VSLDNALNISELTLESAILDSLAANIAVIDPAGVIVAVNLSWQTFAAENAMVDKGSGVGASYLDICRAADPDPVALEALQGIQRVMSGRLPSFYLRYPCHSPSKMRWFALRASPLRDHPNFVVVTHEDVTEQVLARVSPRPMH